MSNQEAKKQVQKRKRQKTIKKYILYSLFLIPVIIIGFIIYWAMTNKSALGQVNDLDKAIRNKDYDTVAQVLKIEGDTITKTEAKHIVDYLHKNENRSRYQKEIKTIKSNVKDDEKADSQVGEITDKKGKPIITVSRNGVKALIFEKLAFTPHYRTVYMKSLNNKATYGYQNDGKEEKAIVNSKTAKLGQFIVGDYDIPTTKIFDKSEVGNDDSVDGYLHINTDEADKDGKVFAKEKFEQSWFKVNLKNTSQLDNNYRLYLDDDEVDFKKNKVYGKFPAENSMIVKAKGRMDNKTISTNEVEVSANKNNKPQTVTLTFKEKEIESQLKKDKKVEKEAGKFIKKYTEELNRGYALSDFGNLKHFFVDDTSGVATNIKKQVESKKKTRFKDLKVKSSKKKDNEVVVIISKKNEKKKVITSQYTLKYDEDKKEFKIKEYTDI